MRCPNCQNELGSEHRLALFCPSCGQRLPAPMPEQYCVVNGVDLRSVARGQRVLLWLVLLMIGINILVTASPLMPPLVAALVALFFLCGTVVTMVQVVSLSWAMKTNAGIILILGLLTLAPCANLLVLLVVSGKATNLLRKAGLRVGFMGVRDQEVLRRLHPRLCRQCGYDLAGNVSGRCPECGVPVSRTDSATTGR